MHSKVNLSNKGGKNTLLPAAQMTLTSAPYNKLLYNIPFTGKMATLFAKFVCCPQILWEFC